MTTRHKWADVIIAWANGEEIQSKTSIAHAVWVDMSHLPIIDFNHPNRKYRIKPKESAEGEGCETTSHPS